MTKLQYLNSLQAIYRIANLSDSDSPTKAAWLDARASNHQCQRIDQMLHSLVAAGSITAADRQTFYDTL